MTTKKTAKKTKPVVQAKPVAAQIEFETIVTMFEGAAELAQAIRELVEGFGRLVTREEAAMLRAPALTAVSEFAKLVSVLGG
jgi:hypothetical protein